MSEMRIITNESITSYTFYNLIIPKINNYLSHYRAKKLIFDLSNTNYIEPNIIPSFLSLGMYLKEELNEAVGLFIPWLNKDFLQFLDEAGFISIVNQNNIFYFYQEIGGYDSKRRQEQSSITFSFKKGTPEDIIYSEIREKSSHIFEKAFGGRVIWSNDDSAKVLNAIVELCYNASEHSNSSIFFLTLQYIEHIGLSISISDYGIGFNGSFYNKKGLSLIEKEILKQKINSKIKLNLREKQILKQKLASKRKLSLKEEIFLKERLSKKEELYLKEITISKTINNKLCKEDTDSLLRIFDACFFRMLTEVYGLFNICSEILLKKDSRVRIHSNDTQLILTDKNSSEIFNVIKQKLPLIKKAFKNEDYKSFEIYKEDIENFLADSLIENFILKKSSDLILSNVRRIRFPGVHIEIVSPEERNV